MKLRFTVSFIVLLLLMYSSVICAQNQRAIWDKEPFDNNNPLPTYSGELAYDSTRNVTVLWTGSIWAVHGETWEYDGTGWTRVSNTGPSSRFGAELVYDSNRNVVVLYGGYSDGHQNYDTWEWNGSKWTEVNTTNTPTQSHYANMVFDSGRNVVVLYGGSTTRSAGDLVDEVWEYDGTDWTKKTPVAGPAPSEVATPGPRRNFSMAYYPTRGTVVVYGGVGDVALGDSVWEWDGTSWAETPSAGAVPDYLHGHSTIGGYPMAYSAHHDQIIYHEYNKTYGWNGTTWTLLNGSAPTRTACDMVYDSARSKMVTFSGTGEANTTWEFTAATNAWNRAVDATWPEMDRYTEIAWDKGRNRAVLFGFWGRTWEWFNGTWNLVHRGTQPSPWDGYQLVFDTSNQVVLAYDAAQRETWSWNGTAWTQLSTVGATLRFHTDMAYDSNRNRAVLFGGEENGSGDLLNDIWEWDGTNWTKIIPVGDVPAPRSDARLAYSQSLQAVVMFGGQKVTNTEYIKYNDLWSWDGTSWTQLDTGSTPGPADKDTNGIVTPATVPQARDYPTFAYDEETDQIVLFGGATPQGNLNDTWTFKDGSWQSSSANTKPSPRNSATAAFNPNTKEIMVYGGDSGDDTGDVELWNLSVVPIVYHNVVVNSAAGGTTDKDGTNAVEEGTNFVIKATPYNGFKFAGWTGDVTSGANPLTVSPTADMNITANFVPSGSLQVFIMPAEVNSLGAAWSIVGQLGWHNSGDIVNGLSTGTYTVEFADVEGYVTPASTTVLISQGINTKVTATYADKNATGQVSVNITGPGGAAIQWQIPGESGWHSGGEGVYLEPGTYTILIKPMPGYIALPLILTVEAGGSYTLSPAFYPLFEAPNTCLGQLGQDLLITWNTETGEWLLADGTSFKFGGKKGWPVPGDYDGDGKMDRATWYPDRGLWRVKKQFKLKDFGSTSCFPVPADYDGDGMTDPALYNLADGTWLISFSSDRESVPVIMLSKKGTDEIGIPVPGDYDGDGVVETGLYYPEAGTWVIDGMKDVSFGRKGDIPVPGDYDGDGTTDIAVVNMSKGLWRVMDGEKWHIKCKESDIPAILDIDGDGAVEPSWYRQRNNSKWIFIDGSKEKIGEKTCIPISR